MTHAWCHDIARDAAVRAAEDGRTGPRPTLGEAIVSPFADAAERSPTVSKTVGTKSVRTERFVLDVTHSTNDSLDPWSVIRPVKDRVGKFVRVVDETHFDDLAQVAMERDAAIRERDEARQVAQTFESLCLGEQARSKVLQARVAKLEAASGGGEGVPDYYVYKNEVGMILYTSPKLVNDGWGGCTVEPVYKAPPQPRGWLSQEERLALDAARTIIDGSGRTNIGATIDALLARSSPPQVVMPNMVIAYDDMDMLKEALAAACGG
jgi:hypothetical protein